MRPHSIDKLKLAALHNNLSIFLLHDKLNKLFLFIFYFNRPITI